MTIEQILIFIGLFTLFFCPFLNGLLAKLSSPNNFKRQYYRNIREIVLVGSLFALSISGPVFLIVFLGHTAIIMDGMTKDDVNVGWSTWRRDERSMLYVITFVSYFVFLASVMIFSRLALKGKLAVSKI